MVDVLATLPCDTCKYYYKESGYCDLYGDIINCDQNIIQECEDYEEIPEEQKTLTDLQRYNIMYPDDINHETEWRDTEKWD